MKKITLILFAVTSLNMAAQSIAGYAFTESAESYSAVAGTNSTATGDDGTQNNIPIGFSFPFGGSDYGSFSISTNGFIRLGAAIGANNWINELGPTSPHRPLIAPFWDDHNRGSGAIRYALSGTAPNRTLEIGWNNINISGGGNASTVNFASFKLRLHETTGQIDFVYGAVMNPVGTPTASIGLNGEDDFISILPAASGAASSTSTAVNTVGSTVDLTGKKYTFMPMPQCDSTPDAGSAQATSSAVCDDVTFTLSLSTDFPEYGLSFQWQSSVDGVEFADIEGATGRELVLTQGQDTFYRAIVTCAAGGSDASEPVQVLQTPANECYCFPNYDFGKTDGDLISNVVITGTTLSNNTGTLPVNPFYSVFQSEPFHTAELQAGATYEIQVTVGSYGQQNVAVWVDYNDDLVFSDDEKVGFTTEEIASGGTGTFDIQLACDPPAGAHRMRIRDVWNTQGGLIDPCATYGYGETEDYVITILAGEACAQVDNITIGNVNSTSALVSWETGCGHTGWDVFVGPAGGTAPSAANYAGVSSPLIITGLDASTDYEIWILAHCGDGLDSGWAGPFAFTTAVMAVANDECNTSFALTVGGTFDDFPLTATNVGASKSIGPPNPTCGTFAFGGDVWFSVVVPESGSVSIETRPEPGSNLNDTAMSVYTGDCTGLTALGCSDDEGIEAFSILNLSGLEPGSTIHARVWEYANDSFGTFRVSAYHASLGTTDQSVPQISVVPNPTKGLLYIRGIEGKIGIHNLLGQQVMATYAANGATIDVSALPSGPYIIRSVGATGPLTAKFVKQ